MDEHKCSEAECVSFGQPSSRSCDCHQTEGQLLRDHMQQLESDLYDAVQLQRKAEAVTESLMLGMGLAETMLSEHIDKFHGGEAETPEKASLRGIQHHLLGCMMGSEVDEASPKPDRNDPDGYDWMEPDLIRASAKASPTPKGRMDE